MPEIGERLTDSRGRMYLVRAKIGSGGQGETTLAEESATKLTFVAKTPWKDAGPEARVHAGHLVALNLGSRSRVLLAPSRCLASHAGHLTKEAESALTLSKALLSASWPLAESLGIAAQLAAGAVALENLGIVHGDLAGDNVLVSRVRYGCPRAYLIDFDGARGPRLPETGIIGHAEYFAPEIARGESAPTRESDRFALAVLLYHVLLLRHPLIEAGMDATDYCERIARGAVWREDPRTGRSRPGLLPVRRLSLGVLSLFRRAFAAPESRPSAQEWFRALTEAMHAIFACNECGSEFVNDAEQTKCPACGERPQVLTMVTERGGRVALKRTQTTLGRADLDMDHSVSDVHLHVSHFGVVTMIEDARSTNGTEALVAGEWRHLPPGRRWSVAPGLELRLGGVDVRMEAAMAAQKRSTT